MAPQSTCMQAHGSMLMSTFSSRQESPSYSSSSIVRMSDAAMLSSWGAVLWVPLAVVLEVELLERRVEAEEGAGMNRRSCKK